MNMNKGMGMGMEMLNKNENKSDIFDNEIIFDSSLYSMSCFLFSLEDLKIYYKENVINLAPNFIMKYNKKYQSLLGSEGVKQMSMNQTLPDFIFKIKWKA